MRRSIFSAVLLVLVLMQRAAAQTPDDLLNDWNACVLRAAQAFALGTKEAADVVADGAFGTCQDSETAYITRYMQVNEKTGLDEFFRTSEDMRKHNRDRIIAEVLSLRMKNAN